MKKLSPISIPIGNSGLDAGSFNKSHAACYALIAYRTAWLRAIGHSGLDKSAKV